MNQRPSTSEFTQHARPSAAVSWCWLFLALAGLLCVSVLRSAEAEVPASQIRSPSVQPAADVSTDPIGPEIAPPRLPKEQGQLLTEGAGSAPGHQPAEEITIFKSENLLPASKSPVEKEALELAERERMYMVKVDTAKHLRQDRNPALAREALLEVLESNAPPEPKRAALLELALVAQDEGKVTKAQKLFGQYTQQYSTDPAVPEVFLRQGLLYRQMGMSDMAIAKFYNVLNSALMMKLDQFDYYRRLVLQAQTEIADTYYLQGQYENASDFFKRVLKQDSKELNRLQINFKLLRCLHATTNYSESVAVAERILKDYPSAPEVAEVRFLFAASLKGLGRNREAMRQVLELLAAQQSQASKNPLAWAYWQQRAGNDVANQLYKEGDYVNALEIYLNLAEMNQSAAWQLPVWYQIGLSFERLHQPQKAGEYYQQIVGRAGEVTTNAPLSLKAVVEMAKWRQDFLGWQTSTEAKVRQLQPHVSTNTPNVARASP